MNKIPTIFLRDPENPSVVTRHPNPEADWVFHGEGVPTLKRDGTNVRVDVLKGVSRMIWKRRNPSRIEKALGEEPGYVLCVPDDPSNKHIWAAIEATDFSDWPDGEWPCEALGPKIQGGADADAPMLYPFSWQPAMMFDCERTFEGVRQHLEQFRGEGIVWHHPSGRMAKIKRRDFGFPWPIKEAVNG